MALSAPQMAQADEALRFTLQLKGRAPEVESLSADEATAMFAQGFRFSIFNPEASEIALTRPYKLAHNLDRDTLTIIQ
ncbi:hypothetical protein [Pelagibacterium lentulum]|uniref:Uncharacterized protein n=1 Tax=Pelagibacterium lentulum TaxID=2029865 RepID=A0A916RKH1_9HYPH|nr:hypothetical protein [Pelagibacterium lentulum]GGA60685.1 hypothetical protein GCM10011499_33690 [Pelagibacterium lentulum]